MTVAVDCRHIDSSGIGVYLRGILPEFLKTDNTFLLLGNTKKTTPFLTEAQNADIAECDIKCFSPWEIFFFPRHLLEKINAADAFFTPYFNIPGGITVPIYTTIHDIIFPDMPELTSKIGLAVRMWFYRRAYKKSAKIFTVSEFSKSRIEHYFGKKKPIMVTHSAIQDGLTEYRVKAGNLQKKEIILFVGNIKKHKGLAFLLEAYIEAKKQGLPHKLLIIGSKENFRSADNSAEKYINAAGEGDIIFTGFITDGQLMEYMSAAALLVQPSLYEGFGLPPLEAMTLGTHALISDITVFREIYSDFPVTFFRAGDSIDLKNKMMELLYNKPTPQISLSLVEKYTFEKTAAVILEALGT